jgi:ElaB/YqjD/DUF883 family membrane-anchored ribosome-binding protein
MPVRWLTHQEERKMTISSGRFGEQVGDELRKAENKASSTMQDVGGQVSAMADSAQHVAQEQLDRLADSIRRNPIQATGIAAGIGFALALLARR